MITVTFENYAYLVATDPGNLMHQDYLTKIGWKPYMGETTKWFTYPYTKVNGVSAFDLLYARYRKQVRLVDLPGIVPNPLTKADLNKALPKNKVWVEDGRLVLSVSLEIARNWGYTVTGAYNAGEFNKWLYSTGWAYEEGLFKLQPTELWVETFYKFIDFYSYVKVADEVGELAELYRQRTQKRYKAFPGIKAKLLEYIDNPPLYRMFAHQEEWVQQLSQPSSILAFDMGLGKTLMGAYFAKAAIDSSVADYVIVLAPKSVMPNWENILDKLGVVGMVYSWASIPDVPDANIVLIADESHYTQDPQSSRSVKFSKLAGAAIATLMLSGTPSKNGTCRDIFVQLQAAGFKPAVNKAVFSARYGWKDEMSLDKLARDIKPYVHYAHKDDVLDLPAKMRVEHIVELSDHYKNLYYSRYNEFMDSYLTRVKAGLISDATQNLVELSGCRLASALGKVEGVAELANSILESGNQVVIMFDFREPIEKLEKLLAEHSVVVLTASDSIAVRDKKVKDFQEGRYKVFMTTFKCGGVGIELTPCTYMILGDRPWTPGDAIQAEDRCHRIGQTGTLTTYWVYWDDPQRVESLVDEILHEKQSNINAMFGSQVSLKC